MGGQRSAVSTSEQNLDIQEAALKAAGCEVIRSEKRSGTTTTGRAELQIVLDFLRPGDALMVTRIDRLARSIGDLQDIVRAVKAKGATLKATEQPIDTGSAAGKCFLDMLGVFAEFETNLRAKSDRWKASRRLRLPVSTRDVLHRLIRPKCNSSRQKAWDHQRLLRRSALVGRRSTALWRPQ